MKDLYMKGTDIERVSSPIPFLNASASLLWKKMLFTMITIACCFTSMAQPVNDNPATATPLLPSLTLCGNPVNGTTVAATPTATPASTATDDVWYRLDNTTPGNITISLDNVSFVNPGGGDLVMIKLWMYLNFDNSWTGYAPSTNGFYNTGNISASTPGSLQFYVQIYTVGGVNTRSNFTLCARYSGAEWPAPSNDDCSAPQNITSQLISCASPVRVSTLNATPSTQPFMFGTNNNDSWYRFTAQEQTVRINAGNIVYAAGNSYPAGNSGALYFEVAQNNCGTYTTIAGGPATNTLVLPGLSIGTEYLIRAYVANVPSGNKRYAEFDLCVNHVPPLTNDEASTATVFSAPTADCFLPANAVNGTTLGATQSPQARCASGTHYDVWYSITPATNYLRIRMTPSGAAQPPMIELWDAGATARIACVTGNEMGSAVTSGTNYKVRVAGYSGTIVTYSFNAICTSAPPANDACSAAFVLPQNNDINTVAATGNTAGATTSSYPVYAAACTGTNEAGDVWYKFTAVANSLHIELRNVTSGTPMVMQLFSDCSNDLPIASSCTGIFDVTVLPGSTYYLRILRINGCGGVSFALHTSLPPAPLNDECDRAMRMVPYYFPCEAGLINYLSGTTVNARQSAEALGGTCSSENNDDVWFRFTTFGPSDPGTYVLKAKDLSVFAGPGYASLAFELYRGDFCGSRTYVTCGTIPSSLFMSDDQRVVQLPSLLPSSNYYLRLYSTDQMTEYDFKLSILVMPTATNITCATARPLTAAASGQGILLTAHTISPMDEVSCTPPYPSVRGVWYSFVATATSHYLDLFNIAPLSADGAFAEMTVYSGTCGALTQIQCFGQMNYEGGFVSGLTIGQTYYVCVKDNSINSGPIKFCLRINGPNSPNNEPADAFTLIQDHRCLERNGSTNLSTVTASPAQTIDPPYLAFGDVWYKFSASSPTSTIQVTPVGYEMKIAVYNNSLVPVTFNIPGNDIAYPFSTFSNNVTCTVGQTYYVRITTIYNGAPPATGSGQNFSICITGIPTTLLANNPAATTACQLADGPVVSTNSYRWLHITDQTRMVASVFDAPGGTGMGNITAQYYTHTGSTRSADGAYYANRNYQISPTTQPTDPVRVRYYLTQAELDALIIASASSMWPITSLSDLKIRKFSDDPCATLITRGGAFYPVLASGEISPGNLYVETEIPSFSSFFLTAPDPILLPLQLISFNATPRQEDALLEWETDRESIGERFIIEWSVDGTHFNAASTIQARAGSGRMNYRYTDAGAAGKASRVYYRLRIEDPQGQHKYSPVKMVMFGSTKHAWVVYPNPSDGVFEIYRGQQGGAQKAIIYDAAGHQIGQVVMAGSGSTTIDLRTKASGMYLLVLPDKETLRLMKR